MISFRFLIALSIISAAASRLCRGSPGESCFGFAPWCYGGPFRTYKARHSRESIHTGTAFRVIEVVFESFFGVSFGGDLHRNQSSN